MAKSARQHVFEGMELLPDALIPFVELRLKSTIRGHWQPEVARRVNVTVQDGVIAWDQQTLLKAMMEFWKDAFAPVLGVPERAYVSELLDARNKLSHNAAFSRDDAARALDTMHRLLEAISAGEVAGRIAAMRDSIHRMKFIELRRNEERRKGERVLTLLPEAPGGLRPWRDVVTPHSDVAQGTFTQADFAADLGTVHTGKAPDEYRDPVAFFSRTHLTEGLRALLEGAARRLSGTGGDPVVELQTGFGGGKTHSMLALYHMAGPVGVQNLPGLDQLGLKVPERVARAVMVGTARGPNDPLCADGLTMRTTWGQMAWQMGGAEAYARVADHDARGVAPGSVELGALFRSCAPCLILIDEWVAFLRHIYKVEGLPSGSFDANLTFVQSLTEAVKQSPGVLLVASLPASQIEVGGTGGAEALHRLKQTFHRVESSWRPANQEESYEIVRRRLFRDVPGDAWPQRDATLKRFAEMYRDNRADFPAACAEAEYRRKLEIAYPIHPELFDQLYTVWGALETFQRTRGVLRLMAQVVHDLWMGQDASAMIMPGSVAIASGRVEPELRRYLNDSWQSIIAGDVDGDTSTPYKIDQEVTTLNRVSATRRVARAIFMGSAPANTQRNTGLDDKQINLGVLQPGERVATFGDALRRLANQARYMHSDSGRYWYSTRPGLNRLAADRAEAVDAAEVTARIENELRDYINGIADRGDFEAVQVAPASSADVPDEAGGVRAVVLGLAQAHHPRDGATGSAAVIAAADILNQRGAAPRLYPNTLVFLAADARQVDALDAAARAVLGWGQIVREAERLDLTISDSARAKANLAEAQETMCGRLRECWSWLLYPHKDSPQADIGWVWDKIVVREGKLLSQASSTLGRSEALVSALGASSLARDLRDYIWNDQPHISLGDLWEYLNRYLYLPRLKNAQVLVQAVRAAVQGAEAGPFAYADCWDAEAGRYSGLLIEGAQAPEIILNADSVLVRPDVAKAHRPPAAAKPEEPRDLREGGAADVPPAGPKVPGEGTGPGQDAEQAPTRFIGTVEISADRFMRDMGQIREYIVDHLTMIPGSEVTLRLEIDAEVKQGLDREKERILGENADNLGFIDKSMK
ncbi:MAG: ATP-binding protein [Rhodobacteraceae bacterium]|nr:ATP-binding protein [Paracoccaceae bacterium]